MKKILSFALAMTMVFALAACGSNQIQNESGSDPGQQIPNPITVCETLEEAEKLAGIELSVPDSIDGCKKYQFLAYEDLNMAEVCYQDGENSVTIRKGPGETDISGDYNEYAMAETLNVDQIQVTVKGADDLYNLAIWTNGDNSYAVSANKGLPLEVMTNLIPAIQ